MQPLINPNTCSSVMNHTGRARYRFFKVFSFWFCMRRGNHSGGMKANNRLKKGSADKKKKVKLIKQLNYIFRVRLINSLRRETTNREGYLLLWFESASTACWVHQHRRRWLPPPWIRNPPRGSDLSPLHASSVQAQNQELGLKNLELRRVFFFLRFYCSTHAVSSNNTDSEWKTGEIHQMWIY